jgi:hypothetical protein
VYVPTQQYDEECVERRQLAARVEEMEAEAEAVGAQHELAKAEWQGEMAAAAAKHEQQMGKVRGRGCAGALAGAAGVGVAGREGGMGGAMDAGRALSHFASACSG